MQTQPTSTAQLAHPHASLAATQILTARLAYLLCSTIAISAFLCARISFTTAQEHAQPASYHVVIALAPQLVSAALLVF